MEFLVYQPMAKFTFQTVSERFKRSGDFLTVSKKIDFLARNRRPAENSYFSLKFDKLMQSLYNTLNFLTILDRRLLLRFSIDLCPKPKKLPKMLIIFFTFATIRRIHQISTYADFFYLKSYSHSTLKSRFSAEWLERKFRKKIPDPLWTPHFLKKIHFLSIFSIKSKFRSSKSDKLREKFFPHQKLAPPQT